METYLLIISIRKQRSLLGIIGSVVACFSFLSYFSASVAYKCLGKVLGLVINHFDSTINIWPSQIFSVFILISNTFEIWEYIILLTFYIHIYVLVIIKPYNILFYILCFIIKHCVYVYVYTHIISDYKTL